MRKISSTAASAFIQGRPMTSGNTAVIVDGPIVTMALHGNHIARYEGDISTLVISSAGWRTATTKERLNAIPGVSIKQKAFGWYLNGKEWDGGWIKVRGE